MNDPYGSHLPVLKLPEIRKLSKRVLEFGGGLHSTGHFLGVADKVTTVETDPDWAFKLEDKFGRRDNFTLRQSRPESLRDYDLVFVDDGTSAGERIETLEWILARKTRPPVLLHDAEVPEYRLFLEQYPKLDRVTYRDDLPWTELIR